MGDAVAVQLTPEEEKQTIREIITASEARTKAGDTFYLITPRWWQDWLKYVNQSQTSVMNNGSFSEHHNSVGSSALTRPPIIENSDLIYETASEDSAKAIELQDTLVEGTDYILLPEGVWNQLYSWYGGCPVLAQKVIDSGLSQTELSIEVYPLRLQLHLIKVYIWDYYSCQKHALMNDMEKTLDDSNIQMDQDGELALAFSELLRKLWVTGRTPVAPRSFKAKLARFAPQFSGCSQHDSQELLAFLLDGLHEDLNRVKHKPYTKSRDADGRPDEEVADEYWANHIARNDSIIVDVCQVSQ